MLSFERKNNNLCQLICVIACLLWQVTVQSAPSIETLYKKKCAVCHGNKGDGKGRAGASLTPPATAFTALRGAMMVDRTEMIAAVALGIKGTAMVGYQRVLSTQQIHGLVDYIRQHFIGVDAPQASPVSEPVSDIRFSDGKVLYTKHCSACHGDKGNTAVWAKNGLKPPPRDFTSPVAKNELSVERMLTSIKHGRPGTAMMPFQTRLQEQQIMAVIVYIRQAFMHLPIPVNSASASVQMSPKMASPDMPSHVVDFGLPFPNQLQGNMMAGEQFYMHNCVTCHGKQGDGKGPRAHFNRPAPRNFTSEVARKIYNRPRLFEAVSKGKPGSVMAAWATVLTAQEIANVAEFVFQRFILNQAGAKKKL